MSVDPPRPKARAGKASAAAEPTLRIRTVKAADLRGLKKLADLAGSQFKLGVVLYDGSETLPLGDGLWAAPLSTLWGD